jgi:hypothetical protein
MKTIVVMACAALVAAGCEEKPRAAAPAVPPPKAAVPQPIAPKMEATPAAAAPAAPAAASGERVTVAGLSLAVPSGWKSVTPSNPMRLAELSVPDASGDASKACTVAFSTAGGDIAANIERWAGQVKDGSGQPSKATPTTKTVAGMTVHVVEMTGAFSAGMGDATVRENWMLRGAIVETPTGLLFIKMTGPAEPMAAAGPAFNSMIDGLTKS